MVWFLAQSKCSVSNGKDGKKIENREEMREEQRVKKSSEFGFLQTVTRNFTVGARKVLIRIILVTKYWARGFCAGLVNANLSKNFSEVSF